MGYIQRKSGGTEPASVAYLRSNHLVGRGRECHLIVSRPSVSMHHASIQWTAAGQWELRDFGSRNGTTRNGESLGPKQSTALSKGDEISFGESDEVWTVANVDPPRPMLIAVDTGYGYPIESHGDVYPIPSAANPMSTLYIGPNGQWFLERGDQAPEGVVDGCTVEVDGYHYGLYIPDSIEETIEASSPILSLGQAHFDCEVSQDEESAGLKVTIGGHVHTIPHAVPLYLLAYLARVRLSESQASNGDEVRESEVGWVSTLTIQKELALIPEQLSLQVFRIRSRLKELRLLGSGSIVERRRGWLRIGVQAGNLSVTRADA